MQETSGNDDTITNDTNPLRSFRERNVRIFFGGLVISGVGTWVHVTSAILLIVELGGGGLELGIVTACQFLPLLLLGLYAGAFADRHDRFALAVWLQAGMGLIAIGLGIVVLAGGASIPVVYVFTAALGVLATFDNPARRTFATELVPARQLANITALSTSIMTGARMFGPALAAFLVINVGTGWAFIANGASFLIFILALLRIDRSKLHPIDKPPPSETPIRDGLSEVWGQPGLRVIVVGFALVATFAYNSLVAFPLLVEERLGERPEVFALMLSVMSLGNVIGSLMVARQTSVKRSSIFAASAVIAVTLTAVAVSTALWTALIFALILGMGSTTFVNSSTIYLQQNTEPALRGRVLALTSVLFLGSTPIGGPITGLIGDAFGAVWANLYGALPALAFALVGIGLRAKRS